MFTLGFGWCRRIESFVGSYFFLAKKIFYQNIYAVWISLETFQMTILSILKVSQMAIEFSIILGETVLFLKISIRIKAIDWIHIRSGDLMWREYNLQDRHSECLKIVEWLIFVYLISQAFTLMAESLCFRPNRFSVPGRPYS